jgi:hypothetical protein
LDLYLGVALLCGLCIFGQGLLTISGRKEGWREMMSPQVLDALFAEQSDSGSSEGPYIPLMPMHPRAIGKTSGPVRPSLRIWIAVEVGMAGSFQEHGMPAVYGPQAREGLISIETQVTSIFKNPVS